MPLADFGPTVPLTDLGTLKPEWTGVLSPLYDEAFVSRYVHEQFLTDASAYIEHYEDFSYWWWLLDVAHTHFDISGRGRPRILDVGSGSGNTLFPLLDMHPDASVVASDLSIPLLVAIRARLAREYGDRDCNVLQLNAEDLVFEEGRVDLVVGGAILHPLFDPRKTIEQAFKVLRPGGVAVFFEPFEAGNQILGLVLKSLVATSAFAPEAEKLSHEVADFFVRLCHDLEVRKGRDKSDPIFARIDDKWIFTKRYFEELAAEIGFSDLTI